MKNDRKKTAKKQIKNSQHDWLYEKLLGIGAKKQKMSMKGGRAAGFVGHRRVINVLKINKSIRQ